MNTIVPAFLTLSQPTLPPRTRIDSRVEMFQNGQPIDAFFNMKALAPRPVSDATEMFDTDFEEDQSELEDNNSPRLSINSVSTIIAPLSPSTNGDTERQAKWNDDIFLRRSAYPKSQCQ